MEIAATVGLLFLLLVIGAGIAVRRLVTSKLPQPSYRLKFGQSIVFLIVCVIGFLLFYFLGQLLPGIPL